MHTSYNSDVEEALVGAFVSGQAREGVYKTLFRWAVNEGITNRIEFNDKLIPMEEAALNSQFPDGVDDKGNKVFGHGGIPKTSFMPAVYQAARSAIGGALESGYGLEFDENGEVKDSMSDLQKMNPNKRKPRNKDTKALKLVTQLKEVLETGPFEDESLVKENIRTILNL